MAGPALVKIGATLASGAISSVLTKPVARWRTARQTSREARDRGIVISARAIRRWLVRSDVQGYLTRATPEDLKSTMTSLARLIHGSDDIRQAQAIEMLEIVCFALLANQPAGSAAAIGDARGRSATRSEGAATREAIGAATEELKATLATSSAFDEDVRRLHPWRQEAVAVLRSTWPPLADFTRALIAAPDRASAVRQWAMNPPQAWQSAPADVHCLFGLLASDYGEAEAFEQLLEEALDRGLVPADYWRSRRALSIAAHDEKRAKHELNLPGVSSNPLGRGLLELLKSNYTVARETLASWEAKTEEDISIKAILMSSCAAGLNEFNEAVALLTRTAHEVPHGSGAALRAAELLLTRSKFLPSANPLDDRRLALGFAIQSRDARRAWGGDSAAAVQTAIKAAVLGGDVDRAWSLTQQLPAGEATEAEASDPRVLKEALILASMLGKRKQVESLMVGLDDPFIEHITRAHQASHDDQEEEAVDEFRLAYAAASDDTERMQAAMGLAERGATLPDLDALGTGVQDMSPKFA